VPDQIEQNPEPDAHCQRTSFSFKARVKSFQYALAGGRVLLASQHNARIHALATVLVLVGALAVRVSRLEWALLILAIALVWGMEALNTAIELLADEVSLEQRPRIGKAKDVAAFGVLVAAMASVLIGVMIFVPHFFH